MSYLLSDKFKTVEFVSKRHCRVGFGGMKENKEGIG